MDGWIDGYIRRGLESAQLLHTNHRPSIPPFNARTKFGGGIATALLCSALSYIICVSCPRYHYIIIYLVAYSSLETTTPTPTPKRGNGDIRGEEYE